MLVGPLVPRLLEHLRVAPEDCLEVLIGAAFAVVWVALRHLVVLLDSEDLPLLLLLLNGVLLDAFEDERVVGKDQLSCLTHLIELLQALGDLLDEHGVLKGLVWAVGLLELQRDLAERRLEQSLLQVELVDHNGSLVVEHGSLLLLLSLVRDPAKDIGRLVVARGPQRLRVEALVLEASRMGLPPLGLVGTTPVERAKADRVKPRCLVPLLQLGLVVVLVDNIAFVRLQSHNLWINLTLRVSCDPLTVVHVRQVLLCDAYLVQV